MASIKAPLTETAAAGSPLVGSAAVTKASRQGLFKRLSRTVLILSTVSFLTDLSSEMIYPLLPVFLSSVLGAGALALGVIEGVAESTAAVFKVVSGIWTDRTRRRKPLIVSGYGISSLLRPLIGLATVWPMVLGLRFVDRIGKGLRTSPRDTLIAETTLPSQHGSAYGFHRASDHAGAVLGPLIAAALLSFESFSLRHIFLLSAVPAVLVIVILATGLKEPDRRQETSTAHHTLKGHWKDLGRDFKLLLGAMLFFTLGNSTDAFLLLRLSDAGVHPSWIALLWSVHHIIKMVSTYFGGRMADSFGSRRLIISGWIFYAAVYSAFAITTSAGWLITVFLAYGIYFGLTEPAEKSWVAGLVPSELRGTAFGYYHGVVGLGSLPASLLFGFLWHSFGVATAFSVGAGLAVIACLLLLPIHSREAEPAASQR